MKLGGETGWRDLVERLVGETWWRDWVERLGGERSVQLGRTQWAQGRTDRELGDCRTGVA